MRLISLALALVLSNGCSQPREEPTPDRAQQRVQQPVSDENRWQELSTVSDLVQGYYYEQGKMPKDFGVFRNLWAQGPVKRNLRNSETFDFQLERGVKEPHTEGDSRILVRYLVNGSVVHQEYFEFSTSPIPDDVPRQVFVPKNWTWVYEDSEKNAGRVLAYLVESLHDAGINEFSMNTLQQHCAFPEMWNLVTRNKVKLLGVNVSKNSCFVLLPRAGKTTYHLKFDGSSG